MKISKNYYIYLQIIKYKYVLPNYMFRNEKTKTKNNFLDKNTRKSELKKPKKKDVYKNDEKIVQKSNSNISILVNWNDTMNYYVFTKRAPYLGRKNFPIRARL